MIKPVEPTVSEVTPTGGLAIGFSEPVIAFGGKEVPEADDVLEIEYSPTDSNGNLYKATTYDEPEGEPNPAVPLIDLGAA